MNYTSLHRPQTVADTSPTRYVPHYMRAKTDTLHHHRLVEAQQQQQQQQQLQEQKDASSAQQLPSLSQQRLRAADPGIFCSTYEVSYSPLRQRPETSPTRRVPTTIGGLMDNDYQPQLPPNVNPASLREKQRYLHHKSRDVPPPTHPSQFIIDLQHHMRNTSKAEFSRNVRKTEPPNLERIFGTDDDAISTREIIRRHNEKLRLEDEERKRHRSLLYNKAEYAARHAQEESSTKQEQLVAIRPRAKSAANHNFSSAPSKSSVYFNQKQFEKYAPSGWDRPAQLEHEKRVAQAAAGYKLDWATDTIGSQKIINRQQFDLNKAQAAGVRSDKVDASRRQYVESPHEMRDLPPSHTAEEMVEFERETERQNSSYHPTLRKHRPLPKHIRAQLSDERTPNDVVMKYVVDPVLRMELVEKQRQWRSEYQRLKEAYGTELEKKNEAVAKIKELQAEKLQQK